MFLAFRHSFTHSSPVIAGNRLGLRLDRVLVCEVLTKKKQTVHLGHSYKLLGSEKELGCEYRFDVLGQGASRMTWLHSEELGGPEDAGDELTPLEYF